MFSFKILVTFLVLWTELSICLGARRIYSRSAAMEYLKKYGHMNKQADMRHLTTEEERNAIMSFQKMAAVKMTGLLDGATLKMMERPRCGMADVSSKSQNTETRWPQKSLTYAITKYPSSTLTKSEVHNEIGRAFKVWSDQTDLTFREQNPRRARQVDIDIRFEVGSHGDIGAANDFDGPDGTLAHAFFPENGKAHFDDSEPWTVGSKKGVNLFQIAAHEFGHNLGLNHSDYYDALMFPMYMAYEPNFKLHRDDIERIQALYGKKTGSSYSGSNSRQTTVESRIGQASCEYPEFDTIFTDLKEATYIIKGSQFWKPGSVGVSRQIKGMWSALPPHIDAAFSHRELDKTYFFSGANVWRYQGVILDKGYPTRIAERFPGIPDNLDAAFVWPRNNQIYFFKGTEYWMFDWTKKPQVPPSYPRLITAWWRGVPDALDAVFVKEGKSYFVKDGVYSQFDDWDIMVKSRGVIGRLLGCRDGPVPQSMDRTFKIPRPLSTTSMVESMAQPKKCTSRIKCWKP